MVECDMDEPEFRPALGIGGGEAAGAFARLQRQIELSARRLQKNTNSDIPKAT